MARIDFPESGMGEHVDWALLRTDMAVGMGQLSTAVYGSSRLPVREREAARWTIALINDCAVCKDTRAASGPDAGIDDGFYAEVADARASTALTERERLAAEFARRFALDHHGMDDAFWATMRASFADDELADLTICCATFLGLGRALAVMGVPAPERAHPRLGVYRSVAPQGAGRCKGGTWALLRTSIWSAAATPPSRPVTPTR